MECVGGSAVVRGARLTGTSVVLGLEVIDQTEIVVVIAMNWSEINASDAGSDLQ